MLTCAFGILPSLRLSIPAVKPLSAKATRILQTELELKAGGSTSAGKAFFPSLLTQVSLPHRSVNTSTFERRCGKASILLQRGQLWNGEDFEEQIIPYGPMPRIIISALSTFAKLKRTQEVPIGNSASEFLKSLGYSVGGGGRGSFTTLIKQLNALAAVKISFGFHTTTIAGNIVQQFDAWKTDSANRRIWPKRLILSDQFYSNLEEHAVPLNLAVLRALRGSSLSLDIYAWLARRLPRVDDPHGDEISWASIKDQFGQEYADTAQGRKDFKREFRRSLEDVLRLYPQACVRPLDYGRAKRGLLLFPSPPPISRVGVA
jgi:hypothetical protein